MKTTERDESIWVAEVLWIDGSWGPFPGIPTGRTRVDCRKAAEQYFTDHNMTWPYEREGSGTRYRFRKYVRQDKP